MAPEAIDTGRGGAEIPDDLEEASRGRSVVVCVGNRYMKDDGVGPEVAAFLKELPLGPEVLIATNQGIDLALLAGFRYAKRLVVVDALRTGKTPGTVSTFAVLSRKNPIVAIPGLHEVGFLEAVDAARLEGLKCPVTLVGIEPEDCGPGEGLTERVKSAVPLAAAAAADALGTHRSRRSRKAI